MNSTLKDTYYIDKESAECLVETGHCMFDCEDLTSVDKNYIDKGIECRTKNLVKEENTKNDNGFSNCLEETVVINQNKTTKEIHKFSNNTNYDDHILNKAIYPTRQNETWSFVKEFDLFLQKYEATYDGYNSCTNMGPFIPTFNETEEFVNDIINNDNLEDSLDSKNLEGKSDIDVPLLLLAGESEETIRNMKVEDPRNYNNVESITVSDDKNEKLCNTLNTDIELKYVDDMKAYNHSHEFIDNFIKLNNNNTATDDGNENIIVVNSKSEELSIEEINIDPSAIYTTSLSSNMKNDFINDFETDVDSDGYNSSDFEFIEEADAYLGDIINKSSSSINNFTFNYDELEEHASNLNDSSSSKMLRSTEPNRPLSRYNSRSSNGSESELNNHVILEGENLYELFAEPWVTFNYHAENKAFFSNRAMHVAVNNFGFNVGMIQQRHEENEVDENVKQEALDNAKKIVMMYPMENKRRRRRH